jgi:hypothetical protein
MMRTCSRVAGEIACPNDIGVTFVLARRDGIAADGGDDGRVAQRRLGADDRVRDVVVDVLQLPATMLAGCVGSADAD